MTSTTWYISANNPYAVRPLTTLYPTPNQGTCYFYTQSNCTVELKPY